MTFLKLVNLRRELWIKWMIINIDFIRDFKLSFPLSYNLYGLFRKNENKSITLQTV